MDAELVWKFVNNNHNPQKMVLHESLLKQQQLKARKLRHRKMQRRACISFLKETFWGVLLMLSLFCIVAGFGFH